MKIGIYQTVGFGKQIVLPVESFDEIKDWYIKWNVFHYTTDDETWNEVFIEIPEFEEINMKRPYYARLFDVESYETIDEQEQY